MSPDPARPVDNDGDEWHPYGDGTYWLPGPAGQPRTLDEIRELFGPLQHDPAGPAGTAPTT